MFNMMIKDLALTWKTIIIIAGVTIFLIFTTLKNPESNFVLLIMSIYMISYISTSYEDRNKSDVFLVSLPVKRKNIVMSKYIMIIPVCIFSLVVYMVGIFLQTQLEGQNFNFVLDYVFMGIAMGIVTTIVLFPINYIFGPQKVRIIFLGLYFIIMFFVAFTQKIGEYLNKSGILNTYVINYIKDFIIDLEKYL